MVRHWDEWDDGKRSHLFVAEVATGQGRDLSPKFAANVPPAPFGGSSDYAFSPNGKELAFTAEPLKDMAWSTNTDVWIVSVAGNEPQNLTADNPGADAQPSYSPDGDYLAFVSQARAGFEADKWALKRPRPERWRDHRRHRPDRPPGPVVRLGRHACGEEAVRGDRPRPLRRPRRLRLRDDPRPRPPGRRRRPRLRQRAAGVDQGRRQQLAPGPPRRRGSGLRPRLEQRPERGLQGEGRRLGDDGPHEAQRRA